MSHVVSRTSHCHVAHETLTVPAKVWLPIILSWLPRTVWRASGSNPVVFVIVALVACALGTAALGLWVDTIDAGNENALKALLIAIACTSIIITHDIGRLFGIRLIAVGGGQGDMAQITGVAIKVNGPLSLAGLYGAVLFGIIKGMFALPIWGTLPAETEFQLLYHVVDVALVAALAALVLGVACFVVVHVTKR